MARRRKRNSEDGCLSLTIQLMLTFCFVTFCFAAIIAAVGVLAAICIIGGIICIISFLVSLYVRRWRDKHPETPSFSEMIVILVARMLGYVLGYIEDWKSHLKKHFKKDGVDSPLFGDQSATESVAPFADTTPELDYSSEVEYDSVHPIDWPPRKTAKKKYSKEFIDLYAESCNAYLELEEEKETYKVAFEENPDS